MLDNKPKLNQRGGHGTWSPKLHLWLEIKWERAISHREYVAKKCDSQFIMAFWRELMPYMTTNAVAR